MTNNNKTSFTQQTAKGSINQVDVFLEPSIFMHDVSTSKGTSGAGVIELESQTLVGINTFRRCPVESDNILCHENGGTAFYQSPSFYQAVKSCLDSEELE